jgi:hypothetical protein
MSKGIVIDFDFTHELPLVEIINGEMHSRRISVTVAGEARQYQLHNTGRKLYYGHITHILHGADQTNVLELVKALGIPSELQVRANVIAECALLRHEQIEDRTDRGDHKGICHIALAGATDFGMLVERVQIPDDTTLLDECRRFIGNLPGFTVAGDTTGAAELYRKLNVALRTKEVAA